MLAIPRVPSAGWVLLVAALVLLASATLVGQGHPIQDNNEGLYARVALEMLERHSWTIPTVDGVPYLEKPPLLYWITALSFALFGPTEAAARFGPVIGFLLLLAALYVFGRRWWDERTAVIAACVAASSPLVIVMSRMLMFDMLFTGLYAWAVFAMYEGVARAGGRRWISLSYAALALAVMTKGFVAIVFYAALIAAVVWEHPGSRREKLRRALDGRGLAIFAALATPWHVAAAMSEPTFTWFYVVNEHVLRFLGLRVPHDYYRGSYFYYVPRLLVGMAPWILVLAAPRAADPVNRPLRRFLWMTFLVPFTFFSVAGAKANYYLVVAVPPLALLVADRLQGLQSRRWRLVVPLGWCVFFALLCAAVPRFAHGMRLPASAWVLCACAFALSALSALAFRKRGVVEGSAAAAAVAIPLAILFSAYLAVNRDDNSTRGMAAEIERRGLAQVFVFRDYEAMSSLGYYLHRPLGIIDSASNDLWYGLRLRPDAERFPLTEHFLADARYRAAAIVVADRRRREFMRSPLASHMRLAAIVGHASLFVWRTTPSARHQVTSTSRSAADSAPHVSPRRPRICRTLA